MNQHRKQSSYLLLMLSAYIILQFLWWGYMLVAENPKKTTMVVGEGLVFLIILVYGIWRYQLSLHRELTLHQRQSNFLLSVTHELKTPISSVQLILQTILKHNIEEDQRKSFIEKALDENKKSEALIQNMLHAAGIEHNRLDLVLTEINLLEFFSSLNHHLTGRFGNSLSMKMPTNHITIHADKYMLESVINQLADNSFKYGAKQVNISIEATKKEIDIIVSDDGIGVSEADRPFIFEKFYRSGDDNKREQSGTGLGLYIAKEFIGLHNGTLSHNHRMPCGSIFTIKLPK